MTAGVRLRPALPGDEAFLRVLHASTRDHLAALPEELRAGLLALQYAAQEAGWRSTAVAGEERVVEVDGTPAGRLVLDRRPDSVHVVDIALLPAARGTGLGGWLLRDVVAEATASGLPVTLHVARDNPARRLYERLGFTVTGGDEVRLALTHPAGGGGD